MLLVLGMIMIVGSLVAVHQAVAGETVGRVPKERIATYAAVEQRPLLTRITDGAVAQVEALMRRRGWRPFTAMELELAGVRTPVASLVVMVLSASVVAVAVGTVLLGSVWFGLLVALPVPLGSKGIIRLRTNRRRKKFADQLSQALQMIAASLRAGHGITRAMEAVAQDAESPMNEEFARVSNEVRLGRDLVEALEQVSVRMNSQDFYWVAGAISAQRETGGNLNEILDQVAETIRERNHIRQQVRSLSAEGRLPAYILMAPPVAIGVYYGLGSHEIMGAFVHAAIGKVLMVGCAIMYVLGGLWMRSVVRIEF